MSNGKRRQKFKAKAPWLKSVTPSPTPVERDQGVEINSLASLSDLEPPESLNDDKPIECDVPVVQEKPTIKIPPTPPSPQPASRTKARRPRRPDYRHSLVGLEVGDSLVFHKNPLIEAYVVDSDWRVEMMGKVYGGLVLAAIAAYEFSGIQRNSLPNGLSDWKVTKYGGKRLNKVYTELVQPV